MGRPSTSELERLRARVWARMLCALAERSSGPATDRKSLRAEIERGLLAIHPGISGRLQAFSYVYNKGGNPRLAVRRVPTDEISIASNREWRIAVRQVPDRDNTNQGRPKKISYAQIPIDLVARAEELWPTSSAWFYAAVWRLVSSPLLSLDEVRYLVKSLLGELGMFRPSQQQYEEFESMPRLKKRQLRAETTHTSQLLPLAKNPTAVSFSLLVALTLESFLLEKVELCEFFRKLLSIARKAILRSKWIKDVAGDLDRLVLDKAINLDWQELPGYTAYSVDFPPLSCKEYEARTGNKLAGVPILD